MKAAGLVEVGVGTPVLHIYLMFNTRTLRLWVGSRSGGAGPYVQH